MCFPHTVVSMVVNSTAVGVQVHWIMVNSLFSSESYALLQLNTIKSSQLIMCLA